MVPSNDHDPNGESSPSEEARNGQGAPREDAGASATAQELSTTPETGAEAGPGGTPDVAPPGGDEASAASRPVDDDGRPRLPSLFDVQLPVFEGPLDLLLHLVREHRLDVFDIPIAFITEKYLAMVDKMRELNLDVAGEYLLMAATLAHIKSRMLLPRPEPESEDEAEESGDPRGELVRRLLEYQKYRDVAETLGGQDILGRDVFAREATPGPLPLPEGELGLREVSLFKLIEALDQVLRNAKVEVPHEVLVERVSIGDRISELVEVLRRKQRLDFLQLFEGAVYKGEIITTFLALLEMARLGLARIFQESAESEIRVGAGERIEGADLGDVNDDFR